jgi:hypothetical protein
MKKQIFTLLVLAGLFYAHFSSAQVYPYSEDFQAVTPASCFGDCSGSTTYLTNQGWGGNIASPTQHWLVNDNYGVTGNTKALGVKRFSLGSVTNTSVISPSIGAITSSSLLKFKYRIVTTGSNSGSFGNPYTLQSGEYVRIDISNDNFATHTVLHTINSGNHTPSSSFSDFSMGIVSFAGQNVKIRWVYNRTGTTNHPDWTFIIDQIQVEDGGPDVGAIALQVPESGCGLGASEPVQFKVKNYGPSSVTNVPVTVSVNSTNYTHTVAGPIASGGESSVQTVNVNLSTTGTYTISVTTNLVGDSNASNNSTPAQNVNHISPQNIPYSTSFEASDPTLPLWKIIDGAEPVNSTARAWQTNTERSSQGSQAMLYRSSGQTMAANDWLISPCLNLTAGTQYEVRYKVSVKTPNNQAQYHVKLGNDDIPAAFTTTLYSRNTPTPTDINGNNTFVTEIHTFTVPSSGIWYLAWHATSGVPIFSDDIFIDEVVVKVRQNTDVELISFDTPTQSPTNCYSNNEAVKVTIRNAGINNLSNINVTVNVTGAITQTLSQTVASLNAGQSLQVTVGSINMTTAGNYTFAPQVSVSGDQDNTNNALPSVTLSSGASASPVVSVNFTGYTGTSTSLNSAFTGWYEKRNDTNYPTPGDTQGSYWTNTSRFSGMGTTACINLFTDTAPNPDFHKNDMIVSPLVLLGSNASVSFKIAVTDYLSTAADNMGSDDFFQVVVISNCGATITPVYTVNIANNNVPDNTISDNTRTVSLASYAGQTVQIGFLGSTGSTADTQDYDFHLDDIQITGVEIGGFSVNLGPDQNVCNTAFPITLDCGVAGATNYAWTRNGSPIGGNTQTLQITQGGTYQVAVTKNSVTKTDEVVVNVKPDATASFTSSVNNLQVSFTNTSTNASSYTWNFGDGNTSSDVNPTHTYANAGTYNVTLTAVSSQGCANGTFQANVTVTAPPTTALSEDLSRVAVIFPNPNNGKFNIQLQELPTPNTQIFVYDLQGKLIWQEKILEKESVIQLKGLKSGVYAIRLQTEKGNYVGKITLN